MIPSNARVESEGDLAYEAINTDMFLRAMERAGANLNIIILDACRDNPLPKSTRAASASRGLTVTKTASAVKGAVMLYSAGPNQVAEDGPRGQNGIFTGALLETLGTPGLKLEEVFKETARRVQRATNNRQTPWMNASLTGDFYFNGSATPAETPSATASSNAGAEVTFWQSIADSTNVAYFAEYLRQYPTGRFSGLARLRIADLQSSQTASLPVAPAPVAEPDFSVRSVDDVMFVQKRANIRSGPGTEYEKVIRLDMGESVDVTGHVEGSDWSRLALRGGEIGYIYTPLLGENDPRQAAVTEPAMPEPSPDATMQAAQKETRFSAVGETEVRLRVWSAHAKYEVGVPQRNPIFAIDGDETTSYQSSGTRDFDRDKSMWWEADLGQLANVRKLRILAWVGVK
jgi:hypothetical protein